MPQILSIDLNLYWTPNILLGQFVHLLLYIIILFFFVVLILGEICKRQESIILHICPQHTTKHERFFIMYSAWYHCLAQGTHYFSGKKLFYILNGYTVYFLTYQLMTFNRRTFVTTGRWWRLTFGFHFSRISDDSFHLFT